MRYSKELVTYEYCGGSEGSHLFQKYARQVGQRCDYCVVVTSHRLLFYGNRTEVEWLGFVVLALQVRQAC